MAKFNKLKEMYIDGVATQVPEKARISDVVGSDVSSIETQNPVSGKFELIGRDQFNQDVPAGMTTNLTPIAKGGHDDWEDCGDGWHINKRGNGWLVWHSSWGGNKNLNHYHLVDDGRAVHKPTRKLLNQLKNELRS